jgi:hypothetical protein
VNKGTKTRLLAGFLALLLNGCASIPDFRPDPNLPQRIELDQTPFFPQDLHQCGPAALATLLSYRGLSVTPQQLTSQVYLPERAGSLQVELTAAARRYGMLTYPLAPRLEDLLSEVAAGNPVLVLQNLAFGWLPRWHYAVAIGYDLEQREILLRSGRERRWRSSLTSFNNTWKRSGYWGLVILTPDRLPASAELLPYLKAALELEQTGQQKAAVIAYRSASRRWPDDARPWLALGNLAYSMEESIEAISALKTASELDPGNPVILNNLAYSYLQGQCPAQALQAIRQARVLAPADNNLRQSFEEILGFSSCITEGRCILRD